MRLQLTGISVSGDGGMVRLRDVDCAFPQGQMTLLIGKTGSGKSTLLDVAAGLICPTSGSVHMDGQPLWLGRRGHRRNLQLTSRFGTVFQQAEEQLFAQTVEGEFRYSLRHLKLQRTQMVDLATTALADVDLPADLLPRSPFTLSGGQKRRVALATTMAAQPDWWFLDEPTAGLDGAALKRLTDWVQSIKQATTGGMVIATHDLDAFLPLADRVIILSDGRIVQQATPAELLADPDSLQLAGVGLPSALELASLFGTRGVSLPLTSFRAEDTAMSILEIVKGSLQAEPLKQGERIASTGAAAQPVPSVSDAIDGDVPIELIKPRHRLSLARAFDPRAKWIAYLLVTIGFILGTSWVALGLSAVLTGLCIQGTGVGWRRVQTLARPFALFILFSTLFSGIRIQGSTTAWLAVRFGFDGSAVLTTFHHIVPFFFVMCVGILLPETTSQLRMKQGLEQGLSWLQRIHLPVEALSLGMSLMLRFVPLISEQVSRFSRIASSRSHRKRAANRLSAKDFVVMAVPLIIALLKLGDELSHAMEVRGYRELGQRRSTSMRLRFRTCDWILIGAGALVLAMYLVIRPWS